jgi:AcrR family transcriptional regulator
MKTSKTDAKRGGMAGAGKGVRRGRPREFDLNQALDAAVRVFWEKGYEGASLPDLTRAMGINRPSLYAAFGDKKSLFRSAVDRYVQGTNDFFDKALAEPRLHDALLRLLTGPLTDCDSDRPRGCLLISGALACATEFDSVRRELAKRRHQTEIPIRARLARAVADGELPPSADIAALAKFIATFQNGMAVQHSGGADKQTMLAAARVAMRAIDAAISG